MVRTSELSIEVNRSPPSAKLWPFTKYFKGFENVQAVKSVFGEETATVLKNLKVSFVSPRFMYMGIRDEDGSITIGTYHLKHGDLRTLYLDIIHELFHIKQWQGDKKYFEKEHRKFVGDFSKYYSSPIEVPAYKHTVREAERIGMSRDEIVEHLKMGPTPPGKVFTDFLKAMEFSHGKKVVAPSPSLPVRINRNASIAYLSFKDYFKGFENVAAIRSLLGGRTDQVLNRLKVEFVHMSFARMLPSDEDGHILVGVPYLKSSDTASLYLDVLLCLNLIKRAASERRTSSTVQNGFGVSPALLESYKAVLEEARRIGVPDAKVMESLSIARFLMDPADFQKFLQKLGLAKE